MQSGRTLSREQIEALERVAVSAGWRGHYRLNGPPPLDVPSTRVIGPIPNDLLQPFPADPLLGFQFHDPWQAIDGFDRGRGDGDLWFHDLLIEIAFPESDQFSPAKVADPNKWKIVAGAASRPTELSGLHFFGGMNLLAERKRIHINDERMICRIDYDNDLDGAAAAAGDEMDLHLSFTIRYSRRAWLPRDLK